MYQCNQCGGNLHYDISEKKLRCAYCNSLNDPYSFEKEEDAESSEYEINVFHCPQCGAELLSEDLSITEYCSYCGAHTVLTSRIRKEKRPTKIIPFQITKEECKRLFLEKTKHAVFAPREFRNIDSLDSFRGIYMPYWSYKIEQKNQFEFKSTSELIPAGTWEYNRTYATFKGNLDAEYEGISHDASSEFRDDISERIAPYDYKDAVDFTPSYLSGFYADIDDVDEHVYERNARTLANQNTLKNINENPVAIKYHFNAANESLSDLFNTKVTASEHALFPVWFMAFRKGKRVSYATVNGQTGMIVADLPIDLGKFALGSLAIGALLYVIFNLCFIFKPEMAMLVSMLLTVVSQILYMGQLDDFIIKDNRYDDMGYLAKKNRLADFTEFKWSNPFDVLKDFGSGLSFFLHIMTYPIGILVASLLMFEISWGKVLYEVLFWILAFMMLVFLVNIFNRILLLKNRNFVPWILLCITFIGYIVLKIWHPVEDIYYYSGMGVALFTALLSAFGLVGQFNQIITREIPHFERHTGGDDDANEENA